MSTFSPKTVAGASIAKSRTSFSCSGPASAGQPVPRRMICLAPVGLGQAQLDIGDFIGSRWMRLDPSPREAKKKKKDTHRG